MQSTEPQNSILTSEGLVKARGTCSRSWGAEKGGGKIDRSYKGVWVHDERRSDTDTAVTEFSGVFAGRMADNLDVPFPNNVPREGQWLHGSNTLMPGHRKPIKVSH